MKGGEKDWDGAYAAENTPWDKGFAAPPLQEFLSSHSVSGRVLVPGCGTGHDVRLLAKQGARVVGLDIAPKALEKARRSTPVAEEVYEISDFLNLPEAFHSGFDWVFEHTCLCAIDPGSRRRYAEAVKQALKPGGNYLAIFFKDVPDYDEDGPPYPISNQELDALFASSFETVRSFQPTMTYPSRPVGCEELRWLRLRDI